MGNNSSKTKTGVSSLSNSSVNKNDVNITNNKTSSKIDKKKKKSRKWRIFSILKSKKPELERTKSQRRSKRKYNETKKPKIQEQKPLQAPTVLAPKPQIGHVKTIQDYEAFMINRIKEQLNRDGQAFVLNQLMLSMQFFGNYQREKEEILEEVTAREILETKKFSKHFKSVIIADRIQSAIDKRVKYQASYGPLKGRFLSLDTKSVYIVHENIEVSRADETENIYGVLPDPSVYKVVMEDHNDQIMKFGGGRISYKGYVKLRSLDVYDKFSRDERSSGIESVITTTNVANLNSFNEDANGDDDIDGIQLYNRDDEKFECASMYSMDARSVKSMRGIKDPNGKSVCMVNGVPYSASNSNETSRGSSEYDYAYITALTAHKPFESFASTSINEKLSTFIMPPNCISSVFMDDESSQGYESDNEDDEDDGQESTLKDEPMYQPTTQRYLNSNEFFSYFCNIFRSNLGPELGFKDADFHKATYKGATITISSFEITPAIYCPWPNEAHEWDKRKREAIVDPVSKQKFQWPSQTMINKVMEFGCHVIPLGFAPKRGKNQDRDIEWKIIFPEAERYLEQNFNAAQSKIYMMLKALFRAFIDPYLENGENMFTKEHLRAHMFWQCELNPAAWNENFLGEKLLKVLIDLNHKLSVHALPDYFLPKRNLLENVPERSINKIIQRVAQIIERPTNYLLMVMRDLKFAPNFYPKMRYMKVYNTLAMHDPLIKLNPILDSSTFESDEKSSSNENIEHKKPASRRQSEAVGSMAEIEQRTLKLARVKNKKVKMTPNKFERAKAESPIVAPKKEPSEPINIKLNLVKKLEPARQRLLFDLFVPHFIEICQYGLQKEDSISVAQISIRQAELLAQIFYEQDDKAQKYLEEIQPIKEFIERLVRQRRLDGPNVPRRGSIGQLPNQMTKVRSLGSRKSSMVEDPYVNLNKVMNGNVIDEETSENDEDAKSTLKATRGHKQRASMPQIVISAQVHSLKTSRSENQIITAEEMVEKAMKRHHDLIQKKLSTDEVRIRA